MNYPVFALLLLNGVLGSVIVAQNQIVLREEDTVMKTRLFQIQGSAMWCFNAYRLNASSTEIADPGGIPLEGDLWMHDNPDLEGSCIELLPSSINFYTLPPGVPTHLVTILQAVPGSLNVNGTVHTFVGDGR